MKTNTNTSAIKSISRFVKSRISINVDYNDLTVTITDSKNKKEIIDSGYKYVNQAKKIHINNKDISLDDALYFVMSKFSKSEVRYIQAMQKTVRLKEYEYDW